MMLSGGEREKVWSAGQTQHGGQPPIHHHHLRQQYTDYTPEHAIRIPLTRHRRNPQTTNRSMQAQLPYTGLTSTYALKRRLH